MEPMTKPRFQSFHQDEVYDKISDSRFTLPDGVSIINKVFMRGGEPLMFNLCSHPSTWDGTPLLFVMSNNLTGTNENDLFICEQDKLPIILAGRSKEYEIKRITWEKDHIDVRYNDNRCFILRFIWIYQKRLT